MADTTRLSTLDDTYTTGALSTYPSDLDSYTTLYRAANNAETALKHSLPYNGKYIVVDDAAGFPDNGLLRIGPKNVANSPELVYYGKKQNNVFSELIRGFCGSKQNSWPSLSTYATSAVMAEHHNAVKDALLNIQQTVGLNRDPAPESLNGILTDLEARFLTPRPVFRAYPLKGTPGISVKFQDFSDGVAIRQIWDFGDGTTSAEKNPTHVYAEEGVYTIKLNIVTANGAQGVCTKNNYITVDASAKEPFFYVVPTIQSSDSQNWSVTGAEQENIRRSIAELPSVEAQAFEFVDQTDADITQRYWVMDDGSTTFIDDPDSHTFKYTYQNPGTYRPSLLLVYADQSLKRVFLTEEITVL